MHPVPPTSNDHPPHAYFPIDSLLPPSQAHWLLGHELNTDSRDEHLAALGLGGICTRASVHLHAWPFHLLTSRLGDPPPPIVSLFSGRTPGTPLTPAPSESRVHHPDGCFFRQVQPRNVGRFGEFFALLQGRKVQAANASSMPTGALRLLQARACGFPRPSASRPAIRMSLSMPLADGGVVTMPGR